MEIRQHALLYALIAKHCLERYGKEKGEELLKKITVLYGNKRGQRMAALTKQDNEDTDLNSFFIHGEWKGRDGENISLMSYEDDQTVSTVTKCAWYDTWKEYGLLNYGTYYCRYIDKAICEGFDGDFSLDVQKSMGRGDDECIFCWNSSADKGYIDDQKKKAQDKWIRSFDLHCEELYACAKEILADDEEILELISKDLEDLREGKEEL